MISTSPCLVKSPSAPERLNINHLTPIKPKEETKPKINILKKLKLVEEARVTETILDSIETTLEIVNGPVKTDPNASIESSPDSYKFKMGHRKKAIQAADNSFVILDRSDPRDTSPSPTTATPKKTPRFMRAKSDIDCFMASRKKMREEEESKKEQKNVSEITENRDEREVIKEALEKSSMKCDECGNLFLNESKFDFFYINKVF